MLLNCAQKCTQTHVRARQWTNTYETGRVAVALREQIMTIQSSLILRSNSTQHRPHLPLRSWSFRLKPLTKRTFDVHEIRRMWTVVPSRSKVVSRGLSRSHPIRIATTFHRTSPLSLSALREPQNNNYGDAFHSRLIYTYL